MKAISKNHAVTVATPAATGSPAAGSIVVEVLRQNRQARRLRGKSDPLRRQAALAVLAGADTVPKTADGHVESMRILIGARRSAAKAKSQTMNQIHALLITAPESVRNTYRALTGAKLVNTLARARPTAGKPDPDLIARQTLNDSPPATWPCRTRSTRSRISASRSCGP